MAALLEIAGVAKHFGGIRALDGVDFTIAEPGIHGLIGPNGAGKTTLFDVITGRVVPDSGSVRVAGVELLGRPSHQLTRLGIARTFQECRIFPDKTCLENVLFAAEDKRLGGVLRRMVTGDPGVRRTHRDDAMRLLALVNLDLYAERPAAALSFGQKRLLEIVSALITRPRMILFDEPASGVNPALLDVLRDFLVAMYRETRVLFLIVEHNMEFIMGLSDRIIVMHQGQVLEEGTPAEVQASRRVIEAYLG